MNKEFSKKWVGSKQPRKQRKFLAKAPLHIKRKLLSVNLSKELRKKYGTRNLPLRKGDTVQIMRGKYKKKKGKIIDIQIKRLKIYIEGIQVKKQDGSKVPVALRPSNLQIIELYLEDKQRSKFLKRAITEIKTAKKNIKSEIKKEKSKNQSMEKKK